MIDRTRYVQLVKDLLGSDPSVIRAANRELYAAAVDPSEGTRAVENEADLALAEAA